MDTNTLTAIMQDVTARLALSAWAENYEASHPTAPTPKHRDTCPTCGSDNAHRLWVSFTDRCASDWHDSK